MIEALKKRYKVGDSVTIYTNASSFSGIIEEYEETCIVLLVDDNVEFISNNAIVRVTAVKKKPTDDNLLKEDTITADKTENRDSNKVEKIIPYKEKVMEKCDQDNYEEIEKKEREILKGTTDRSSKKVFKNKFKSFEDLENLISTEIEKENKVIVSANGFINKFFPERKFGFIADKFGNEVYFNCKNVIEQDLFDFLDKNIVPSNYPVLFSLSRNTQGNIALNIHRPKPIEEILKMARKYNYDKKYEIAVGLVEQVLFAFPDNHSAIKLKNQIEEKRIRFSRNLTRISFGTQNVNYQKATKAKNVDKNLEQALKYYFLALENNEKRESCIKDIAMLYVAMGETQMAIEFMTKYKHELQENITTYFYLTNFYSSVKEFDKVIEQIDLLLEKKYFLKDKVKHSLYLSQKGFALIQLKNLLGAKDVLRKAVTLHRENTYAGRLLKVLDEPDQEKLYLAIAEAEFDSFGGGLSKMIRETLEQYDQYHGVPAKIIDTGDFTQETLNAIRKLIETAGRARPRERANYLLTEAKLMTILEPEKGSNLRSVLARYCNAMALNHISEYSSMDVIRNYYLEAFSLEENYNNTRPQVALFLASYRSTYSELLSTKTPSIDITLKFIIDNDNRDNLWEGVLSMFLWNRSISAQIISKLYDNTNFRNKSLNFLNTIGIRCNYQPKSDEYINLWNQARERRQRDYSRWLASIKAITANDNIDILTNQLYDSLNEAKRSWLSQLDASRLTYISTDILDVLNQYLKQTGYRDKERHFGLAKAQVNQLISEIKEKPTKFSYEGFLPLLEKIDTLLDKSFKTIESASSPIVKISILGEASIVDTNKTVNLKLLIENSKESSPIRDIIVNIQENKEISPCDKIQYSDTLDGGDNCEIHAVVKVSDNVIKDRATTLDIVCSYKIRNQDEPVIINEQLSLRLYSEEEFEAIPNPYEQVANSGPVTDTSMFYGRNEFIERITQAIIKADSKQVVIYGQKRSGKSSVLYHLQKSLENTNKTFCISFSIGDIFENISTATFFYKILSLIEEELENLVFKGHKVPEFKCPQFSEFKENPNPADLFRKYIRNFKREYALIDSWKNKKLVIMIDEFTYLYNAIKTKKVSDAIMKQWKAITQNEDSMFSSVLVGHDVFPMFKDEFPNEFGITQDERLTYLSKHDAVKLIEEPIGKTKTQRNRFIGNAIDTIIDYTSCNPYYIQIFCARLVSEMNRKKYIEVTNADVKEIADSFLNGGQALTEDKFDNLLNAGEKHDIQRIPNEHSKAILRTIANNSMNIGFCLREQINIGNPQYEDEILKDLVKREVLEQKEDSYKIQVKLFQEWLLKH